MQLETIVNGNKTIWQIEADASLADVLRHEGYLSVRKGCDTSCCGLCTVWLDGKPAFVVRAIAVRSGGDDRRFRRPDAARLCDPSAGGAAALAQ